MKKALLATSAIIGAGFLATSSASAADFSISGGFNMDVNYKKFGNTVEIRNLEEEISDADKAAKAAGATDAEKKAANDLKAAAQKRLDRVNQGDVNVNFEMDSLVFSASDTTDTGLTYGVTYKLGANFGNGGNVSTGEAYAHLGGDWGKLVLGWDDGAENGGISGAVGATDFGAIGIYGDSGDRAKISYFSPSFSGFEFGISYTPDKIVGRESDFNHWIGLKLGYGGAAGDDISYDIALVYGINLTTNDGDDDDNTGDPMGVGFGASIGAYGATVALGLTYNIGHKNKVAYTDADGNDRKKEEVTLLNNQLGVGLGVLYDYGQGDVGLNFEYHLDMLDLDKSNLTKGSGWKVGIGTSYTIASGVSVDAVFIYGSETTDVLTPAVGVAGTPGAVAEKTDSEAVSTIEFNVGTGISF